MERGHGTCTDKGSKSLARACPLGRALFMQIEEAAGRACDVEGEAAAAADDLDAARNADVPWQAIGHSP